MKIVLDGKLIQKNDNFGKLGTEYLLKGNIDLDQQLNYFPRFRGFEYSDFVYVDFINNEPKLLYFDCWTQDEDNEENRWEIIVNLDKYGKAITQRAEEI